MPTWISDFYSKLAQHIKRLATHDSQLKEINRLLKRNNELKEALAIAKSRIAELEASATSVVTPTPIPAFQVPSIPKARADGTSASQWATVAATPPTKQVTAPKTSNNYQRSKPTKKLSTKRAAPILASIARFYSSPSETHGFQFLYFKTRGRDHISKVRKRFAVLGIQNSRILDIHYPDNHHVGFS